MKRLKIGVVGSGQMRGQTWISTVKKLAESTGEFELVGVCEPIEERAKACAQRWNIRAFPSLPVMVQEDRPDAVLCAIPPDGNPVITHVAARHGMHVVSEIPIAPTRAIAESMKSACKENNVKLEIAENVYRWPAERLKKMVVESGVLGPIALARLSYFTGNYHGFNAIRSLLGCEAQRVLGFMRTVPFPFYQDYMLWDLKEQYVSSAVVEFANNITCFFEQPPFGGTRTNLWEIEGTQGCLVGDTVQLGKEKPEQFPMKTEFTTINGQKLLDTVRFDLPGKPIVWENPFKRSNIGLPDDLDEIARAEILTQFRRSILENKPVQYGADNAWRDQELAVAVVESHKRGNRWVDLPLREDTQTEQEMHQEYLRLYGHPWHDIDALVKSPLPRGGVRWKVLGDL